LPVQFSNFLASILKRAYEPTQHWTSQRRDAKYEAYDILNCDEHEASFTIPDQDLGGRFTIFILENGIDCSAEWLETPPTYHVIVAGTTGDLDASFPLTNEEWSLVRNNPLAHSTL
jgi:hypothetical protein